MKEFVYAMSRTQNAAPTPVKRATNKGKKWHHKKKRTWYQKKKYSQALKKFWANLTPEQRLQHVARIQEGRKNGHGKV
jgi:hypothetical protein